MSISLALIFIAIGIVALYFGGDFLVDNAAKLAHRLGVSPLFIGLTVVAFGTSAPELAAGLVAAARDSADLVMGNVVGSNTANLALVLGIATLICPIVATRALIRRDLPTMLLTSLLLIPLTWDGSLERWQGLLLVVILLSYVIFLLRSDNSDIADISEELDEHSHATPFWRLLTLSALGAVLLVAGAQFLVRGAVTLAQLAGISERVIGVTLVAVGTSLPELAASIIAAMKRQGDIIIGNLIGSNIFNILSIIGITALIYPLELSPEIANVDFWVMMGVSALAGIFLWSNAQFSRLEGAVMLVLYASYMGYLGWLEFA